MRGMEKDGEADWRAGVAARVGGTNDMSGVDRHENADTWDVLVVELRHRKSASNLRDRTIPVASLGHGGRSREHAAGQAC